MKTFEMPEISVIAFSAEDVICASGVTPNEIPNGTPWA